MAEREDGHGDTTEPARAGGRHPPRRGGGGRRLAAALGALAVLALVGLGVAWYRCGLRGCPDVNMLKGYMPDEASVLVDRNGEEVAKLFVTRRVVVPVDSLPEQLLNAFVAVEDKRFWSHGGVDWRRVAGAMLQNVRAGAVEEGSSTITMQLARNVFPEKLPANEKTLGRKLGEARVARMIESRYSKREILELYVNQIYFGSGAYGIQAAAEEYFGKSASELTLAESALLAALPRAPSRLNPRANRDAALEGRELVLRRMLEQGFITEAEREEALEARLVLRERRTRSQEMAPYFVEAVRRQLEEQLGSSVYTEGYTIHTTLDLKAQGAAEQELERQLVAMESGRFGVYPHRTYASVQADTSHDRRDGTPYLQGAVLLLEAGTGDVLALVGGRSYDDSEFNRATQAQRQPGSAFKPFVYAAAVTSGYAPTHRLIDQPLRLALGNGRVWEPRNYDGSFSGVVSMRQALTQSRNVPTVRLANEVGLRRVLLLAEQFGLGPMPSHPSVVLGTAEVTPLQLTAAYAAFATLGQRPEPRLVTRVVDRHGHVVWQQPPRSQRVIDPAAAFLVTSMLQDVVDRGTGTGVRAGGFSAPAAGKTGTTQDAADIWFVGYTPELVGTIWIGMDRRQRILRGATGGQIVAPVWGRILRQVAAGGGGWTPPSGVEQYTVDETGVVADAGCTPEGATRTEYFLRGTAPTRSCYPTYAYYDTLGYPYDTLGVNAADESGWWDRLRRRFLREDSLRLAQPDTGRLPPGDAPPPVAEPPLPIQSPPGDTASPPPGDPRPGQPPGQPPPDTGARPRPIGEPVVRPPPRRLPPDTSATAGVTGLASAARPAHGAAAAAGARSRSSTAGARSRSSTAGARSRSGAAVGTAQV
jgi:penicillin-binding protein 1A